MSADSMMTLVVAGAVLLGGTTYLALQQTTTVHPVPHRRPTTAGLMSCPVLGVVGLVAVAVTWL